MNVVIANVEYVTKDVMALQLQALDGGVLPKFTPGAHIDLTLDGGLVRQYSLFNSTCDEDRYCIGVLLSPTSRGGSAAVHRLKVGDVLDISLPKNHFPLAPGGDKTILIAGGIGITPILSMARHLHENGKEFHLYYSAQGPDRMAFRELIESEPWSDSVTLHFSGDPPSFLDLGVILGNPCAGSHVYVCGPGPMIDAVVTTAKEKGWSSSNVHREHFSAEVLHVDTDREFVVELASSGKRIAVLPDQSIAQALRKSGVVIPTSCEQGVCGTCLTGLKEGVADHRDAYLTDDEKREGQQIMICCSRAITDTLVLDL